MKYRYCGGKRYRHVVAGYKIKRARPLVFRSTLGYTTVWGMRSKLLPHGQLRAAPTRAIRLVRDRLTPGSGTTHGSGTTGRLSASVVQQVNRRTGSVSYSSSIKHKTARSNLHNPVPVADRWTIECACGVGYLKLVRWLRRHSTAEKVHSSSTPAALSRVVSMHRSIIKAVVLFKRRALRHVA